MASAKEYNLFGFVDGSRDDEPKDVLSCPKDHVDPNTKSVNSCKSFDRNLPRMWVFLRGASNKLRQLANMVNA